MDCESVRERLRDLGRGRLPAPEDGEVRLHLAGCAACRHEAEAERLLDEALGRRLQAPGAPATLRHRVEDLLRAPAERAGPARARRLRSAPALAAAAVLAVGLGFSAGRGIGARGAARDQLADELVSDHLRVLASARPPEVESTDHHTVKPWFEGRLDFAPVVPGDRGDLRLVGGGLGYVGDRKAAVVCYGLRRHRLTLLAFPREGAPGLPIAGDGPPTHLSRRGFEVAVWTAGDLCYALVGDVGAEELVRVASELAAETRR